MRISIAIPVYDFPNSDFFLNRCLESIKTQTFKDYEIVITKDGKMAENTNSAIKKSKGELIKILYMDDFLNHKDALQVINDNFKGDWMATACRHEPGTQVIYPHYNPEIIYGVNTIGAPSVITIKNDNPILMDENLHWLLDCEWYHRMYQKFGEPTLINDVNVAIGIHPGQSTHLMGDEIKIKEHQEMLEKY